MRNIIIVYAHFIAFFCVPVFCSVQVADKPNFVIFLADDLGMGDVGCFGNTTLRTPNIDSIAFNGAKLTHHIAAAAVCTPSRAALLTGRYPVRSGMESSSRNKVIFFAAASGGLPQNETTIAKALKREGYSTAIIGKWHLGKDCQFQGDMCHHPLNHGFDYFYGLPLSNFRDFGKDSVITGYVPNFYVYIITLVVVGISISLTMYSRHHLLASFIFFSTAILPALLCLFLLNLKVINGILMRNNDIVEQPIRLSGLTQRFVQEAKEYLEIQSNTRKPFFLYVSFVHVHTALFTSPEFANKSQHGRYGDNVEELDWAVGEILKSLEIFNLSSNTLVYFSSDNGAHVEETGIDGEREGGYNGIFKGGKTIAGMEGGIRVPSTIMWPGHISKGVHINQLTSQMDIFPTVLKLAGIALPHDRIIDGKSLLPLLTGQVTQSPHDVLFHYCGTSIHAATYIHKEENTVWKIHWTTPNFLPGTNSCGFVCHCFGKFVVHHDPPLLYNLSTDPSESQPIEISSSPKYLKIVAAVSKARIIHQETLAKVPDQFSFANSMWRPWLQPCCNFPRCQCTDSKYSK